jgi:hypothetical protein
VKFAAGLPGETKRVTEIDHTDTMERFAGGTAVRHAVFEIPLGPDDRVCNRQGRRCRSDCRSTESLRSVGARLASTWRLRNLRDQRSLPFLTNESLRIRVKDDAGGSRTRLLCKAGHWRDTARVPQSIFPQGLIGFAAQPKVTLAIIGRAARSRAAMLAECLGFSSHIVFTRS